MQGEVVLVTGGARRIGSVISRTLHEAGTRIVLHCNKSREAADELAEELNAARPKSCEVVQADLLQVAQLPRLAEEAARCFGRLDGLVNNASSFHATPIGEIALENVGSAFNESLGDVMRRIVVWTLENGRAVASG